MAGLTADDIFNLRRAMYGEAANAPSPFMRMVAQTMLNRFTFPGKQKEFQTQSIPAMLKRGYYAVSNPNQPYEEATKYGPLNKFPTEAAQNKWEETKQILQELLKTGDFGEAQFYMTPSEMSRQKGFKFNLTKPTGRQGLFKFFGYQ